MYHYEIVLTGDNNPTITIYADGFYGLDDERLFYKIVDGKKQILLNLSPGGWKAIQNLTLMREAQSAFLETKTVNASPRL